MSLWRSKQLIYLIEIWNALAILGIQNWRAAAILKDTGSTGYRRPSLFHSCSATEVSK